MSSPRLPVEVDPWNDSRWSRVEREMFAKLDSPPTAEEHVGRPLAVRVIVGVALVAAVALVFALRPAAGVHPDRLRVATTASASEVTVGESALTVAPRSLVLVSGDDEHGIDVVLDRGSVTCEVAPRRGRPPFVVEAGDVRVRVVGTRFTVARDDRATSVVVDHGVVEVSGSGTVTVLHDGERWPETKGTESGPGSVSTPAVNSVDVDPGASPSTLARPNAGSVVPRPRGSAWQEPSTSQSTGRGPSSPSQDLRAPPPEASTAAPVTTAPLTAPDGPPARSAQDAFESAARIERSRPDDADALYRQVAASGTSWAPSALFALARLESDRGRNAEAVRHLDEYLSRYPRGINADDARALLQRMR